MRLPLLSSIPALFLAAFLGACSGRPPIPQPDSTPYDGPPVAVEAAAAQHIVAVTAPTGGWSARFDRAIRRFGHTDLFITLTRPNPAFMSTQTLVRHEVATEVPPAEPVKVYIRILAHDEPPGTQTYRLAR